MYAYYRNSGKILTKLSYTIQSESHKSRLPFISSGPNTIYDDDQNVICAMLLQGKKQLEFLDKFLPSVLTDVKESKSLSGEPKFFNLYTIKLSDQVLMLVEVVSTAKRKLPFMLKLTNLDGKFQTEITINSVAHTDIQAELQKDTVNLADSKEKAEAILQAYQQKAQLNNVANYERDFRNSSKEFSNYLNLAIAVHPLFNDELKAKNTSLSELPKEIQDYMLSYL